ncbi:MAG TPA: alkaline phosphatase D family protein [Chthoniobacterales bacterium]|nr:alkaline phosphatase D family protein [Chthoniobacterales bacterium]
MNVKRVLLSLWLLIAAFAAHAQTLTHGPVVGGVTDTQATIFVRTGVPAKVTIRYSTDLGLLMYSESRTIATTTSQDNTATVPISGLKGGTKYYLDVAVDGVAQLRRPYPSFTTFAPAGAARGFKFVVLTDFATVNSLQRSSFTWQSAAAEQPDFVFIGGDFDHRNPKTLGAKRVMFKDLYNPSTPNMDGFVTFILRQFPIAHQWDDHDSGLNNLDTTYPDWNLTQQAFHEYTPSYPLPKISPAGIWQKFSYAQVDFFVLDCRSQRTPETARDDSKKTMLGAVQLQWLENGLLASTATWKIIFTSVVTNPTTKYPDGWAGYQTEWRALRDFIRGNKISNVVFIAGDLHLGAIDNGAASGFPEMCVPQANGAEDGLHCPTSAYGIWSEGYSTSDCSGYSIVTVRQDPDRLLLETADEFGSRTISYSLPSANSVFR